MIAPEDMVGPHGVGPEAAGEGPLAADETARRPVAGGASADPHGAIVFFDGICNLCNGSVQFVIARDPSGRFSFASLQSPIAERLLAEHGYDAGVLSSIVLLEDGRLYERSTAVLRITRGLSAAWPALWLLRVVPRALRDAIYDWVAANRYRWFGRRDECMIPTPELRSRFLDG